MKNFLCIPDSFKGTMSSGAICGMMEESIRKVYPDANVIKIPVADGGEGSVDAFLSAVGGQKVYVRAAGPLFREIEAFYGVLDDGRTAIIEMAACAGLPLVDNQKDPGITTTFGVGQLIGHAIQNGCRKIILGLGGSATNDAGAGAACALGARFFNRAGESFVPVGETLKDITHIDLSQLTLKIRDIEFIAMCDIDNPLYGKTGAAYVFGPQKGATPIMVPELDNGLRHFAGIIQKELGRDVSAFPGSGAAGGMGAGMAAFFNARMQMGIETVLDTVRFDTLLDGTDMVLTGEGKIDTQSLRGKVVIGVARRAKNLRIPVVAVVGDIGDGAEAAYQDGVSAIFSINRVAVDFSEAKKRAKNDLRLTMIDIMRFLREIENASRIQ